MKKIFIYNTESKIKEAFKPIKKGELLFYHCGPTVYWTQHVGNLRGMFAGDIVRRVFEYNGYKVKHIRNYTDVGHLTSDEDEGEDKMQKAAQRDKKTPEDIADFYIKQFETDVLDLNLKKPTKSPRATDYIKQMQAMVKILLDKGFAYQTELAIYFDITKAKNYTRLSKQKLEQNISGAGRGEEGDKDKKNSADFALWFFKKGVHKNALQTWKFANYGEGFPGWHLECSAMTKKLLGDTIDIHMGGIEHIPVHHTNEIAQSEAANGKPYVHYWLHNEHLLAEGGKMSKSEGTGFSLDDVGNLFAQSFSIAFDPLYLRYYFLGAHYRSKQNFTLKALQSAQAGLDRIRDKVSVLGSKKGKVNRAFRDKFMTSLNDDFNTPAALAVLQEVLKSDLSDEDKLATVLDFDKVFGLYLDKNIRDLIMPKEVLELMSLRRKARLEKNWQESDKLRDAIEQMGYTVKDTPDGTLLSKK